jgi:DNA polymerase-3 subunit delta'
MVKKTDIETLSPRQNPYLFGHAAVEQRFLDDFSRAHTPHAYLIAGPKGIGKSTFAYRIARFLLSQGAQTSADTSLSLFGEPEPVDISAATMEMDAQSPLFRRIAAASHTDLLTLSPVFDIKKQTEKSEILADAARKVPDFLSLTPAEGVWRVVIVDAVDQLNEKAANALLKILEEPPANAMLLLVCHEPGSILPTIRSRCRLLSITAPSREAFEQVLTTVAPHIELHDYAALYGLSYGSPGLAITLEKHDGLGRYAAWLAALQPGAPAETVQGFITSAAAIKSPEGWAMLLHGFDTIMHRVSLYPLHDRDHPIVPREEALIAAIAEGTPFAVRQRWLADARNLVTLNDTYNLDKKYTIRLMLDPLRLSQQFPAAA